MKVLLMLLYFTVYFSEISTLWVRRRLLNDGHTIPRLGFGAYVELQELDKVESSVIKAIELGYRLVDTAAVYGTEGSVGRAIANVTCRGIVKREDLFITTKLDLAVSTRKEVVPALKSALKRLQLQYVNLFLIHIPYDVFNVTQFNLLEIWKGLEDAKKSGLTNSIGVSNFNSTHIIHILAHCEIRPAVNEIEVSPTFANSELVAFCESENIMTISYTPLGILVPRPYTSKVFEDPILTDIAKNHNKTVIQIALRYLIDRNTVPIPRSVNNKHIESNKKVSDFHLTQKELYTIKDLDQNVKVYAIDEKDAIPALQALYNATKGLLGQQQIITCNKTRRFIKNN